MRSAKAFASVFFFFSFALAARVYYASLRLIFSERGNTCGVISRLAGVMEAARLDDFEGIRERANFSREMKMCCSRGCKAIVCPRCVKYNIRASKL